MAAAILAVVKVVVPLAVNSAQRRWDLEEVSKSVNKLHRLMIEPSQMRTAAELDR
jgi:hypothetical protein